LATSDSEIVMIRQKGGEVTAQLTLRLLPPPLVPSYLRFSAQGGHARLGVVLGQKACPSVVGWKEEAERKRRNNIFSAQPVKTMMRPETNHICSLAQSCKKKK
jgi:hypothetical protein